MFNVRFYTFSIVFLLSSATADAEDFFTTKNFACREKTDSMSFAATADFPVSGNAPAMQGVKRWMCDVLETDAPRQIGESEFDKVMHTSCNQYFANGGRSSRKIEITRSFEDEDLVTYESTVEDKDSETWVSCDCASFSKADGHRLTVNEIFKCNERQIKQLMWQYRGNLPMEVTDADELAIGNAGYIDGWVIVIGPAYHYTGAEFRIRYETAQPYLRTSKGGDYYSME